MTGTLEDRLVRKMERMKAVNDTLRARRGLFGGALRDLGDVGGHGDAGDWPDEDEPQKIPPSFAEARFTEDEIASARLSPMCIVQD
jgi:hypothetical protein